MKRTNVFIEVSDEVYDAVIAPSKAKKSFGKLMCMLLEAYAYNDSIYSYINGAMDELEDKATEELLKDLGMMSQSLSMFSALESQAEVISDNGHKAFEDFADSASRDIERNNSGRVDKDNGFITRDEVLDIINTGMSDIKSMLKDVLSGIGNVEVHPSVAQDTQVVKEDFTEAVDEVVVESNNDDNLNIAKPISDEEEEEAQKALSNLLGSLGF